MGAVRLIIWVAILVGAAAACGVAGLAWWAIALVEFVAWVAVVSAERYLALPRTPRVKPVTLREPAAEIEDDSYVRVLGKAEPAPAPVPVLPVAVERAVEPEAVTVVIPPPAPVVVAPPVVVPATPVPAATPPVFAELELKPPVARPREVWPPVASQPAAGGGVQWNLWNLERLARSQAGDNEELGFTLVYLRDFAGPDGLLPAQFDSLVRDVFGNLLAAAVA